MGLRAGQLYDEIFYIYAREDIGLERSLLNAIGALGVTWSPGQKLRDFRPSDRTEDAYIVLIYCPTKSIFRWSSCNNYNYMVDTYMTLFFNKNIVFADSALRFLRLIEESRKLSSPMLPPIKAEVI